MVSVLTLPRHSKARYVLVTTDELDSSADFGVDLSANKAEGVLAKLLFVNRQGEKNLSMRNDGFAHVPNIIQQAE